MQIFIIKFLIFTIFLMPIHMPLDPWGLLPKAQDNNQTIDDAIAAAIAAHEADASSHLGDGESLQSHRASEIIDHEAGSVLGDKYTNKEFTLNLPFESLDKYQKSTAGINSDICGLQLSTGATINTHRFLYASAQYSGFYWDVGKDATMQAVITAPASGYYDAYVVVGGDNLIQNPPGLGFKFHNGTVSACEQVWGEEDFEEYLTAIPGINVSLKHLYRVQYTGADNTAVFYVDNQPVATMVLHENFDVGLSLFAISIKNTHAVNYGITVGGIYLSVNPLM